MAKWLPYTGFQQKEPGFDSSDFSLFRILFISIFLTIKIFQEEFGREKKRNVKNEESENKEYS